MTAGRTVTTVRPMSFVARFADRGRALPPVLVDALLAIVVGVVTAVSIPRSPIATTPARP